MDITFGLYPIITALCYGLAEAVKLSSPDEEVRRLLPLFCGFMGMMLGIIGYNTMPAFPADNSLYAAGIGLVSGLAATGVYQAGKIFVQKGGGA